MGEKRQGGIVNFRLSWYVRLLMTLSVTLGVFLTLLLFYVIVRPLPIDWAVRLASEYTHYMYDMRIATTNAYIGFSREDRLFYIKSDMIDVRRENGMMATLSDIYVATKVASLQEAGGIVAESVHIETLHVHLPPPQNNMSEGQDLLLLLSAVMPEGGGGVYRSYLKEVDIARINFAYEGQKQADAPAYVIFRQNDEALFIDMALSYHTVNYKSHIGVNADIKSGKRGNFYINIENINPKDFAALIPRFHVLEQIDAPVSGMITVATDAQGKLQKGHAVVNVDKGHLISGAAHIGIDSLMANIAVNFKTSHITINKAQLLSDEVRMRLHKSTVIYARGDEGDLQSIRGTLNGGDTYMVLSDIVAAPLALSSFMTDFSYYFSDRKLTLNRANINVKAADIYAALTAQGQAYFPPDGDSHFDLSMTLPPMALNRAKALWPLMTARAARSWVDAYVHAGRVEGGSLRLRGKLSDFFEITPETPLPADAVDLHLNVADARLTYLTGLSDVEAIHGNMHITGQSFDFSLTQAQLRSPQRETFLTLNDAHLSIGSFAYRPPDFRLKANFTGDIAPVLAELNRKPFALLKKTNMTPQHFSGKATGMLLLSFPLKNKITRDDVKVNITARTENFALEKEVFGYAINQGQADISITRDEISAQGYVHVNNVDIFSKFNLVFPQERNKAPRIKITAQADLTPDDMAMLGIAKLRDVYDGAIAANINLTFDETGAARWVFIGDLTHVDIFGGPITYKKSRGVAAKIITQLAWETRQKLRNVKVDYHSDIGDAVKADFTIKDGYLTKADIEPFRLGEDNDFTLSMQRRKGMAHVTVRGASFNISNIRAFGDLFQSPEAKAVATATIDAQYAPISRPAFVTIGKDYAVDIHFRKLIGKKQINLTNTKLNFLFDNNRLHRFQLDGTIENDPFTGRFKRMAAQKRSDITIHSKNADRVLEAFGVVKNIEGGALTVKAQFFDDKRDEKGKRIIADGNIEMTDFRLGNVPIIARILLVTSFSSIRDNLRGEGIWFEKGKVDFVIQENRINIPKGYLLGPSLGITALGVYDRKNSVVSFTGTVVPAYTINSFLGEVPFVGDILVSREGEGIFGVNYRAEGFSDDVKIFANPLSLFTPGIFRRIFEVGVDNTQGIVDEAIESVQPDPDYPDDD